MLQLFLVLLLAQWSFAAFDPTTHENWKFLDNANCGSGTASRIIGGENAKLGEMPWLARIVFKYPDGSPNTYECGGSILDSRTILTASHCLTKLPRDARVAEIVVGELDDEADPDCENDVCAPKIQILKPKELVMHGNFDDMYKNDVGLIRLESDIEFNDYVKPICLINGSLMTKDLVGQDAIVAGWGVKDISTSERSHKLLKVSLPVVEKGFCDVGYDPYVVSDDQMCVGGVVGKDSCIGDSGGPLMTVSSENGAPRVHVIGIVSIGIIECGAHPVPGIYTRLSSYVEWVLDNLKENVKDFKLGALDF